MPIPQDARHIANSAGDFVPQHGNNWLLEIAGLDGDGKDLIVLSHVSGALPSESNEEVALPYGNETKYVAGKAVYETMPLVIRDWVDRGVRKAIMDWRRQCYNPATGNVGLPTDYKKQGELIVQATDGSHQRSCTLIGLWPQALVGGTLDMASSEVVQIELTLRYDYGIWNL